MTPDKRLIQLESWLTSDLAIELQSLRPASADASFRRYFRATTAEGSFVAMDAPPDKEDVTSFINIAEELRLLDVHSPKIYAQNVSDGFLLLEDFGNRTYLDELAENSEALYTDAINTLIALQQNSSNGSLALPLYDENRLRNEMSLFDNWFLNKHLEKEVNPESLIVLDELKAFLVLECTGQPQVRVHRDYHSRNLMITEADSPGVIDFQDMVIGPIAYDLVSIFKDCYIEWPREQQLEWLAKYHRLSERISGIDSFEFEQLVRWYDMAGLQRHLKILGIFCRLCYRDGKTDYLNDLPLVAKYTLEILDFYPELARFKQHFRAPIKSVL